MFVDNASMRIVTTPKDFDVMVTENTFGDILTDEASVITGSMGLMPSASIGVYTSLFEPIHGSYPQAAGKNIANPMAAILSAAMLLETGFGLKEEAQIVTNAVNKALADNITRHQRGDGTIPTYFDSRKGSDWVNCMVYVADRLEALAAVCETGRFR